MRAVRLGIFDHFGWAVAVTASATREVVDRAANRAGRTGCDARADPLRQRASRRWEINLYDPKRVVSGAVAALGESSDEFLHHPRTTLGPPWTKDHRLALAAAIVAGRPGGS